jgi:hypothetical protein
MSVEALDHVRDQARSGAADELQAAMDALPADARDRLVRELIEALVDQQVTGDRAMLDHVYNTLVISHQLHQKPGYAESATAAQALDPEDTVDVAEYLAIRHGRRQNPA